jgi:phytanoyl-CoA hydroxylase
MSHHIEYGGLGYTIFRSLFTHDEMDELVEEYEDRLRSKTTRFPRQSGKLEINRLNEHGHIMNTFLNPHKQIGYGDFSHFVLDIAESSKMDAALCETTGYCRHRLVQTMLFEQGSTPAHQDWVYLDSVPRGHLVAGWIALEDIPEDGTKFWVIPGSWDYKRRFTVKEVKSSYYMAEMDKYVETIKDQIVTPKMNKGDVLFWNSRLIHGSYEGETDRRTRLSLACHYVPRGFKEAFFQDTPNV